MSHDHALLLAHAVSTAALAGLIWTVQLVVSPGFAEVGRTAAWPVAHAAHTRRMGALVGLPWAVQGLTLAALLVRRPDGVELPLLLVVAALAAVPVVVTVLVSVPVHDRLSHGWDDGAWRRLVRTNWPSSSPLLLSDAWPAPTTRPPTGSTSSTCCTAGRSPTPTAGWRTPTTPAPSPGRRRRTRSAGSTWTRCPAASGSRSA